MRGLVRLGVVAGLVLISTVGVPASAAPSADGSAVTLSKTVTRTHWENGKDVAADKVRDVKIRVGATKNLRDRQSVDVSWSGAHPTGGLVYDSNSGAAAQQEYPVVVIQCRGVDSTSVPASQRVSPQTCFTVTPGERYQYSAFETIYPSYRMDRYASTADRAVDVGQPKPYPADCRRGTAEHWVPFKAVDGTVYPGGNRGCAGLAPEAANSADSLQPGNTTYGIAGSDGSGSTKFVMQTDEANASLGCSATVKCSLVVIPIEGLSCDAAGDVPGAGLGLPAADRPDADTEPGVFRDCSRTGAFAPGDFNLGGADADLPVTGALWWAASNWRNRISVPLSFAVSANVCDIVSNAASAFVYGAEGLAQVTQQWAPTFCGNRKLFELRHVQTSEPQAKNLLQAGSIDAAFQAAPPDTPFPRPTVQAPIALSGFAIAFSIDGPDGKPLTNLKLDARLIAKLLSESYRGCGSSDCLDYTSKAAKKSRFARLADNPIDMSRDPEFSALNPGITPTNYLASAATMEFMASDSDVMTSLTAYIDADPEARAWLDGRPDPWGMVVNPAYEDIDLPVSNWPLRDAHFVKLADGANPCLEQSPVPWLPLVASPVSNPATVALHLQFDIANSQIRCVDAGGTSGSAYKLTAVGRQAPGSRFVLGLVSLGDAARYQLNTASLQTYNSSTSKDEFDDASGRSFVAPTDAGLKAAAGFLKPDDDLGTWPLPYGTLRSSAGAKAYPGTLLMSLDVPTSGLAKDDAKRYAQLMRYAAGPGQVRGVQNGDLPPGYLPFTGGLKSFASYTDRAADAVEAQKGVVPFVSGKANPGGGGSSDGGGGPSSGGSGPAAGGGGAGGAGGAAGSNAGAGGGAGASSAPSGAPSGATPAGSSAPTGQPSAVAVGRTTRIDSGWTGFVLPVLALAALAALGAAAWTSGIGRRR